VAIQSPHRLFRVCHLQTRKDIPVEHIMCVYVHLAFTAFMLVFTPAIIWLF
jgi:hypothetical protein